MPAAKHFLEDLQSRGRYHFSTDEAVRAFGGSVAAVRARLRRLKEKGEVADPYRGFHVIVPPEYRRLGCLPADHFIPELMEHLGEPYYATLLTAAAYHGAAHQRPQVFQVMVPRPRRRISCGEVQVQFLSRSDMSETPVVVRNTHRGTIHIATAAATALELVGYPGRYGGFDNVATVLAELSESVDAESLASEARRAPLAWVQRLGYLLSLLRASELAAALDPIVAEGRPFRVTLEPSASTPGARVDSRWKVAVNTSVEPDVDHGIRSSLAHISRRREH